MRFSRLIALVVAGTVSACSGEDSTASSTTTPTTTPPPRPPGPSAQQSTDCTASADKPRIPTDLAFHPDRPDELWIVNRNDDSVITIKNPGTPNAKAQRRHDPDAMHFMDFPPAIAFGVGDTFGTCGDGDGGGDNFMGPALFSADPAVFAKTTPNGPGSHLDMLHSTSFCKYMDGAVLTELVPPGTLETPGGIEVQDGLVFVSDNATSKFYAFDAQGQIVRTLDTGLPAGSLAGFTFGPDGKVYFVDMISGRAYRIDPLL